MRLSSLQYDSFFKHMNLHNEYTISDCGINSPVTHAHTCTHMHTHAHMYNTHIHNIHTHTHTHIPKGSGPLSFKVLKFVNKL